MLFEPNITLQVNLLYTFQLDFFNFNLYSFFFNDLSSIGANLDFTNLAIYHYSIPVTKLYYPEPFIAMPSFLHYDPWFFHILIYQYWLWFIFILLVVFFFIIFLCTLRWTNPRIKPRRETRGVSRSKCGDLITATVPTTWAISIIIHESTDAIDFYDGFGTTELAVGIRAFQWGWEYYYPKDLDLNYNLNQNQSFYFGNSLKYFKNNAHGVYLTKYWRFYQLKTSDLIVNPINSIILNLTNFPTIGNLNLASLGISNLNEVNAFKKIYYSNTLNLNSLNTGFLQNFHDFNLYNFDVNNLNNYLIIHPESLLTSTALNNNINNSLDFNSFNQLSTTKLLTFYLAETKQLPFLGFNFFADYDFRRFQMGELLEESFWDSSLNSLMYNDYLLFKVRYDDYYYLMKRSHEDFLLYLFNEKSSLKKNSFKYKIIEKPYELYKNLSNNFYTLIPYSEDYITNNILLNKNNYFYFNKLSDLSLSLEDSYNSFKGLFKFYNMSNLNAIFFLKFNKNFVSSLEHINLFKNLSESSYVLTNPEFKQTLFFNQNINYNTLDANFNFNKNGPLKLNSNFESLYTFKNISNTYDAIQKIFRTKFQEMRSHFRLEDVSTLETKTPFISSLKSNYRGFLGKQTRGFITVNPLKFSYINQLNNFNVYLNTNLTYFYDYPFLLSIKSDAARYIWSDWSSKWNLTETQASSLAKYGMYGMPHMLKTFNYDKINLGNYQDFEQYSSRLSMVRRSYLSTWLLMPFLYTKTNFIFKASFFDLINPIYMHFNNSSFYWCQGKSNKNMDFYSTSSFWNTNVRNFVKTYEDMGTYAFYLSKLSEILAKREYIYRTLKQTPTDLDFNYFNTVKNPIYLAIKTSFSCIENKSIQSDLHLYETFNFSDSLQNTHFFNAIKKTLLIDDIYNLPKSQFKPMRKGIANMVKIHASGAIAMPIELRVQILASSRDVIHSWAIPSAGVKIDCVPGYSSHRVLIFLLSGIYWGQCMEICGRYHHWMPIIVYFMKRDLFLLWCNHFIFFKNNKFNVNSADNFFNNYNYTVAFNKNNWLVN